MVSEFRIEIARPLREVYAAFNNPDNLPRWISGLQRTEPISGTPPVKVVAAQSFHEVVLDPNFATNRYVYFTYFAPPKGEAAKEWPIEHYYNEV